MYVTYISSFFQRRGNVIENQLNTIFTILCYLFMFEVNKILLTKIMIPTNSNYMLRNNNSYNHNFREIYNVSHGFQQENMRNVNKN